MIEITDAERRGWQHLAVDALDKLLRRAARDGLPPIDWSVGTTCYLVGRCFDSNPERRRVVYDAWVRALQAVPWPECAEPDGVTYLHADAELPIKGRTLTVKVAIVADILPSPTG